MGRRQQSTIGTELKKQIEAFAGPIYCRSCSETVAALNYLTPAKVEQKRDELADTIIRRGADILPGWARFAMKQAPAVTRRLVLRWIDRAIVRGASPALPIARPKTWKHNWVAVVTTAPRREPTLEHCVDSMRVAGWEPVVFAEPGSVAVEAQTITHPERLGVWHNWLASVRWALQHTDADVIMTVQDDSLFHSDSRAVAEQLLWPSANCGFLSLYTAKHYQLKHDNPNAWTTGVRRVKTRNFWGSCALAWPRPVLEQALKTKIARNWLGVLPRRRSQHADAVARRKAEPHRIQNSDTAIGKIVNSLKREMWFIDPSPVSHVARHSAIGHGGNLGRRNCYRCADHAIPLAEQVPLPPAERIVAINSDPFNRGESRFDAGRRRWHSLGYDLSMSIPLDLWRAIRDTVQPHHHTLEFGSGVSTTAFENAREHLAIESDEQQANRFRCARHVALANGWYDWDPPRKYDVILVDGPFQGNRLAGVETIAAAASKDAVVFIDDTNRPAERQLAEDLGRRLSMSVFQCDRWSRVKPPPRNSAPV